MNTVALPPMTYVALQLMVNPPKMSTKSTVGTMCPVFASMVAQLTKGFQPYSAEAPAGSPSP